MNLETRVRVHAALADPHRLAMVDALGSSDLTPQELAALAGVSGNLAAHHLKVLEEAGLVTRRVSAGDRRRRYVVLRPDALAGLAPPQARVSRGEVLFVCTHNSARSQFAAGLWRLRTGGAAASAGLDPAPRVHPGAVRAARKAGVDLSSERPRGYDSAPAEPALVVSVCDRAREAGWPFQAPILHWSVANPVDDGRPEAFDEAFAEIARRVDQLAAA